MITDPARALAIAKSIFLERFPGADYAFVAGSIMRGEGRAWSDIDLVVVYRALPLAHRESETVDGVPVEMFVHDPSTLAWFMEQDIAKGRPSLLSMVAEGEVIGRRIALGKVLQAKVAARLAAGPRPLSAEALEDLRYQITDALDDLRGERSRSEKLAIGARLHPLLAELSLRTRDCWNGAGKWLPRQLEAAQPGLSSRYETAFADLFGAGRADAVLQLGEAELARVGGRCFDRFRRDALAAQRIDARSPLAATKDRV
ncbi:hypothetical protein M2333_000710 [Sphingobium sp. B11D3B]|uniref:nucleotidyltransferase domain-containing protein n=1 Tax=unclassified Sphingobium TaxID=2611147 RepID=UPI002225706C|nr:MULTISPECIES: nucleotidyltransferase domain-containing protein [unclassified Sphingobium]MCW2350053.1 hypothetical protein [Sphingobium sp. B12D2B]MCW2369154.1 hypothetical protein [Sphingobium sp. B11D3D]MCW2387664.1 hypothetical protein [Sphingobium sp. B11D3B]